MPSGYFRILPLDDCDTNIEGGKFVTCLIEVYYWGWQIRKESGGSWIVNMGADCLNGNSYPSNIYIRKVLLIYMEKRPWLLGIFDNLTGANLIRGSNIDHKNRLALILLDICLEITFKAYLKYCLNINISEKSLKEKLKERKELHKMVKEKTKNIFDEEVWKNIDFYYEMRCDLYHEESNKTLCDSSLNDFYELVEFIIDTLFNLKSKDYVKKTEEILKITENKIEEIKKIPINKIDSRINAIVVSVKEKNPKDAQDLQDYLRKLGYKEVIPIGIINNNLTKWYKHLFYYDSLAKSWTLSDEGERRYQEVTQNI
ncbi:MAG: hypothetical protein WC867_04080 [Candidatus Pacearchaeota archaeon]|jgi:hypothetical protein